jgi:beta-lactamase class D
MKYLALILTATILFSCSSNQSNSNEKSPDQNEQSLADSAVAIDSTDAIDTSDVDLPRLETYSEEIQIVLDEAGLNGSILVYNPKLNDWISNDFDWSSKGDLPASTFKIVNSIIALETRVVDNDSTLFKWDGKKRRLSVWERDMVFRDAFHLSCVPCYQDIARKVGSKRMTSYLDLFEYGNMKVNPSTIDIFWLEGESKISQVQQIEFLKKFYYSKLPISKRTELAMKRLMVIDKNDNYTLSGKTGWSLRENNNTGWFVGYIEKEDQEYFVATRVTPKKGFDMNLFPQIRLRVTLDAMKAFGLIK